MPSLPPLHELTALLHIEHTLGIATESGLSLSAALQRQIRHVAYEFMHLKDEHFGPNSDQAGLKEWVMATQSLMRFFNESLEEGVPESELAQKARAAEVTLREIRTLQGTQHFFSETLDGFFRGLGFLGVDYDYFASALLWELHKYREERTKEESRFLQPFHDYRDELLAIIDTLRAGHRFSHFDVEERIKRDVLDKQTTREWKDMQAFYDLVGLRIIVGNQREVDAVIALVEGAFLVHESAAMIDPNIVHFFRIAEIEIKNNDRGYRAKHINVRRHERGNGHHHPTAEIQVMTRGRHQWGEIQRLLTYKGAQLPEKVNTVINNYCCSASKFIVAVEEGMEVGERPDLKDDIMILTHIDDDALRSDVLDRLCDMDALLKTYHDRTPQTSESNKPRVGSRKRPRSGRGSRHR